MTHPLRGDAISIATDLIGFKTLPGTSNLELVAYVSDQLAALGADIRILHDEAGNRANLFATCGPRDQDGGVVLSGHTDVVPADAALGTSNPFEAELRGDRLFGRGSCDMKGFLACVLATAPLLAATNLKTPVHFAFTYDEEVGCVGADEMLKRLDEWGCKPAICIVGEPTRMQIVHGHKWCCEYTTRITGRAGHASKPDGGVNALHMAARYVGKLLEVAEDLKSRAPANSLFDPPYTTVQAGRMSSGLARNVIAGSAEIEWEMRPVSRADFETVLTTMRDFAEFELLPEMRAIAPEATITVETEGEVVGLDPDGNANAVALVHELTGATEDPRCVPFGTEAGLYQARGIETVVCGPGDIAQAHTVDEFIELTEIDACLSMLDRLGKRLSQ